MLHPLQRGSALHDVCRGWKRYSPMQTGPPMPPPLGSQYHWSQARFAFEYRGQLSRREYLSGFVEQCSIGTRANLIVIVAMKYRPEHAGSTWPFRYYRKDVPSDRNDGQLPLHWTSRRSVHASPKLSGEDWMS